MPLGGATRRLPHRNGASLRPSKPVPWLVGCASAIVMYTIQLVVAHSLGGPRLPDSLNALVVLTLFTGCAISGALVAADRMRTLIVAELRADLGRAARPDDSTSEIPRIIIPPVVGTAKVYHASTGWDPKVLEIGHRLADKLHAPTMRHED